MATMMTAASAVFDEAKKLPQKVTRERQRRKLRRKLKMRKMEALLQRWRLFSPSEDRAKRLMGA